MNEQELADLFSEQLDRMFRGESTYIPDDAGEVQELLNLVGQPSVNTKFQAGAAAQATFQNQMASWFGLFNGGTPMAILGLSKLWFFAIVTTIVVVAGAGLVAVFTTSYLIFSPVAVVVPTATPTEEVTPETSVTPEESVTPEASPTDDQETETPEPEETSVPESSETPAAPPLVFVGNFGLPILCQGSYSTQSTLVNNGNFPINDSSLVWQVIEGADFVNNVDIIGNDVDNENEDNQGDDNSDQDNDDQDDTPAYVVLSSDPLIVGNFVNFATVPIKQKVKLDVKVKVNEHWWKAKGGTEIKVKLKVDQKFGDHSKFKYKYEYKTKIKGYAPSQIFTIVKQDADWIDLSGVAYPQDDGSFLVDGVKVVTNDCTGLPLTFPPGAQVYVVGWLQPNGTFMAVNINIVNITIINGDFNSGVPVGGGSSDDDDGGSNKGGSQKGGSKKGGSKKGGS